MTSSRTDDRLAGESARKSRRRPTRLALGSHVFIKKGIDAFDPHDPYYFAVSLNWRKFGLLFIGAELSINLLFAVLYALQPGSIANAGPSTFRSAFFFSLETLATVGYGEMYPATTYCHVISSVEIVTGVIFTAIMTGLLFVRFSKPKAKVQYATNAVVTQHNGQPTLMLRIGNARNSLLHDARFTLHALKLTMSSARYAPRHHRRPSASPAAGPPLRDPLHDHARDRRSKSAVRPRRRQLRNRRHALLLHAGRA